MQSPEEHGVHVQEIDCDDSGGLGVQELPPAPGPSGAVPDRCPREQDLPHGGGRDCQAELCEFAVDPAVSPQRVLLRQADDKAGDARASYVATTIPAASADGGWQAVGRSRQGLESL